MTVRARVEAFGAWVRADDRTLLALDRETARGLGIDGGNVWGGGQPAGIDGTATAPIEAHVAVTTRCPASCTGCYLEASPEGAHASFDDLCARLDALADAGVFTVAFGGGEPTTHPDLGRLGAHARARGLTPVVTTSGIGLTVTRAESLRAFAQINVSHDGVGEAYEAVRGFEGAATAERAIALLVSLGIPVGVNVVLTRESFPMLRETCARVASLGAREVQLLRYKPVGRAASLDYLARRLTPADVDALPEVIRAVVATGRLSVRIDCALVPLLSRSFVDVASLQALGVMGCEAGNALASVTVAGRIAPCSFAPSTELPASAMRDAWRGDAALRDFRDFVASPPEPCASCAIRSVCRGGCKVVSAHLRGTTMVPDPECPRVREARA